VEIHGTKKHFTCSVSFVLILVLSLPFVFCRGCLLDHLLYRNFRFCFVNYCLLRSATLRNVLALKLCTFISLCIVFCFNKNNFVWVLVSWGKSLPNFPLRQFNFQLGFLNPLPPKSANWHTTSTLWVFDRFCMNFCHENCLVKICSLKS